MSILIALLSFIVFVNFVFAMKSRYYRLTYRAYSKKFDSSWIPRVAVFVPCKGVEEGMDNYLRAMVEQDYPPYRVYFIVESEEDPAFPIVKKISGEYANVSCVVAGRAEKCCQKNHNLLAAIGQEQAREDVAEIFVFADADVKPSKIWLKDLILPMSEPGVSATTAYRWLKPPNFTFWGTMHAMLSAYIGTLMSSSQGMWGGSMAIKREAYLKHNVGEVWERAVGDDIPLMAIIVRNKLKRAFVPVCVAESENVINDRKALFAWFVRQNQYLKIYCKNLWLTACLLTIANSLTVIIAPLFLILAAFIPPLMPLFYPVLCYMLAMIFIMALSRFEGREGQSYGVWVLMAYPCMIMGFLTLMMSGFEDDILWRGIRYGMNSDGTVSFVKVEVQNG